MRGLVALVIVVALVGCESGQARRIVRFAGGATAATGLLMMVVTVIAPPACEDSAPEEDPFGIGCVVLVMRPLMTGLMVVGLGSVIGTAGLLLPRGEAPAPRQRMRLADREDIRNLRAARLTPIGGKPAP